VLHARWSAASGNAEYTARFDLNYEGAPAPTLRTSVGGKLFDLPDATREGYTFHGWWYSFDNDGSKLSYRYEEGTALSGNVTLLALWLPEQSGAQLTAPGVNVESGAISWNAVSGARSYAVRVLDADGAVVFEQNTGNTTVNVDFGAMEAGVFEIRVTAFATAGDDNNSEAVRYYHNKALDKVSVFTVVEPWMLNFNTVAHAEKYLITVACGNPDHVHTAFDNGTSRSFSFAGCTMPAEGIRFTVTAVARGYASSTSEIFVYKKSLPAIEELRYDEATQTVVWNEVPGAAQYMVSVDCGDAAHAHGFVSCGTQTFVSLKGFDPARITVKVYPVAKGYASPAVAELVCNKTALRTPTDLQVVGSVLSWSAITGVSEYEVRVGDDVRKVTENSFDLTALLTWVEGSSYPISVRALGQSPSAWSDTVTARYLDLTGTLAYANGMLSWSPVIGADFCELQINGGEVIALDAGVSAFAVTLDRAGYNTFRVRFVQGASYSEWESVTVFAHTVIFDPRGGSDVAVQYKAVGDLLTLPVPTKTGYDFAGWYNLPGGPLSNGLAYTDGLFAESGSIVLYAYYTPTEVEIIYNYGLGGSGDKSLDKVRYENHYQLTVPVPGVATGAFGGWFSAPYGMGVQYTDAKGQSLAPWTSLESVELHAFWIDYALEFTLTKINGVDVYTVSAGERIALLEEVTVPATFNGLPVAEVAGNAFKGCTNLKVIHLPDTIRQVSLVDPFAGCTALQAIHVYATEGNGTVRYWSRDGVLFDNGTEATAAPRLVMMPLGKTGTYRIPHGVVEIPANAFANSALSKIVIPASVTSIGKEAFLNCYFLTSVVFETAAGEQPLTIAARAFSGCAMLERITLPARLDEIPLSKYVLSDSVVNLDAVDNAFANCLSLVSINVAAGNKSY
ncbi:MAG: leucine-rich repeat protein, partial [Clostridia bacterium]|nr:leucine-rich repeat protein [Clostridia bacterium]